MQQYSNITDLRNHFYDTMPVGDVTAWDMITWASNMFKEFDRFIDTPPQSSHQGEDYATVRNALIEINRYKAGMAEYHMQHNYRELYGICLRVLELSETALLNTEPAKVPLWYDKVSMFNYLRHSGYDDQIAQELCEKWAYDLQKAFEKGCQKANESQPAPPTPVEGDFGEALEVHAGGFGMDYGIAFEEGAKWARKYLSSIPPADGPWHLKSHNNSEDDDTVWMTDGKLSIYIDEFNFDDFPDADYWLVNFLNKYQFKLSFDDQSPIIISHLEEQVKELQGRKGLVWQPIDNLRKNHNLENIIVKFENGEYRRYFEDLPKVKATHFLDLSDSPAPEQVDPIRFR